jgi:acyl carrier protein
LDRQEVFGTIRDIIVEQLGVGADEVTEQASFQDDMNADSLDLVELIMSMEDKFDGMKIPDEEAEKIQTVGDAVEYVMNNSGG